MTNKGKKSYEACYLAEYRRQNPDKSEQWRINAEIKHLEKAGYTVTKAKKQPEEMTIEELEEVIDRERIRNREYARRWRESHREHLREYQKQYKKAHPEKFKVSRSKNTEYARNWREKHRTAIRSYQRKWSAEHKDRVAEYAKNWRAKNPGYNRLRWQKYKQALERARREQEARIRRDIKESRQKGSGNK